jgi:hypothetical protein
MKNDITLKFISNALKALMILLIMLFVTAIAQAIIVEISRTYITAKYRTSRQACPAPVEDEITRIKRSTKQFLPDGTVHQLVYEEKKYYQVDDEKKILVYDVNDRLIWQGREKNLPYQYLSWPERLIGNWSWSDSGTFGEQQMRSMLTLTPDLSNAVEFAVRRDDRIELIWRYLPDKEYFVAYETMGGIAGYLSASGFTRQKTFVTGFGRFKLFTAWCPQDSVNPVMLWQTDKKVYQIDFHRQTVEIIFQSDKEIKKPIAQKNWRFEESNDVNAVKYRPAISIETPDRTYHLIMRQPEQIFTFTPPADWDLEEQNIALTATENNVYLLRSYYGPKMPKDYRYSEELVNQWWRQQRSKSRERWQELYTVNEKGQLNLINRYDWTEPPYKVTSDYEYDCVAKIMYCVTDFSPPFYSILWPGLYKHWLSIEYPRTDTIFSICTGMIKELHSRRDVSNWSISFVFVLIALWHAYPRRTNWLNLIIWLFVVALFSLAGFLTYWALNHTPLIKCPVCGKKRHLEQSRCVHCGSNLPRPQPRPTDLVFAA